MRTYPAPPRKKKTLNTPSLSFVNPLKDEQPTIVELSDRIGEAVTALDRTYEVIFIDDGSTDASWSVIRMLADREGGRVRGIRFRRNLGKAPALHAGFKAARGETVFTLDADLQDDPREIGRFLDKLDEGFDIVSGWKKVRHDPWHKVLPSRVFNAMLSRVSATHLHDHNCGFKCYRARVVKELALYGEMHRMIPALSAIRGFTSSEIQVLHHPRRFGSSKYGFEALRPRLHGHDVGGLPPELPRAPAAPLRRNGPVALRVRRPRGGLRRVGGAGFACGHAVRDRRRLSRRLFCAAHGPGLSRRAVRALHHRIARRLARHRGGPRGGDHGRGISVHAGRRRAAVEPRAQPAEQLEDQRPGCVMRICVIGSTYPRHHDDPLVPWLREAVGRMARRGHEMTVVVPSFEGLASHSIDGVPVLRFRYAPRAVERLTHDQGSPNKLRKPIYNLLAPPYIASGAAHLSYWAARRRFDVLHVHWPFPHSVLASLAWTPRVPTVATCHGAELALARKNRLHRAHRSGDPCWGPTRSRATARTRATRSNASAGVAGADHPLRRHGARGHGPDVGRRPRATATSALLRGASSSAQGHRLPLRARAAARSSAVRPVRLLITGEGDRKEEWQRLASSLGLADRVQFLGFVSSERLAELYRTCDVYVHPAIYDDAHDTEGLGVSLIEALFNGCPVVASDVGGIVDVIKHDETGLLRPRERPWSPSRRPSQQVLGDRSLAVRLGEGGRRFAETHFDWDRITDETEALYGRVVAPPPAGALFVVLGYPSRGRDFLPHAFLIHKLVHRTPRKERPEGASTRCRRVKRSAGSKRGGRIGPGVRAIDPGSAGTASSAASACGARLRRQLLRRLRVARARVRNSPGGPSSRSISIATTSAKLGQYDLVIPCPTSLRAPVEPRVRFLLSRRCRPSCVRAGAST